MKKMTLITILFAMTGCGLAKQQMCGPLDMQAGCHTFFGDESERLDRVESRVSELEESMSAQEANLSYMMTLQSVSAQNIQALQEQIDEIYLEMANIVNEMSSIKPLVINNTYITQSSNVSVIDPCPTWSSNDPKEMLMVIGNTTLAYFEDGGKRFLTTLVPGVGYKTTDSRKCNFTL